MDQHFPLAVDRRFALPLTALGVKARRDGVTITGDGRFVARFGWLGLETPLDNVAGAHVTEGYRWWTAIGPRLSFADDGLTFGSNPRRGVCVHFEQRVPKVIGFKDHSALTVTVADCEGLVAALDGGVSR